MLSYDYMPAPRNNEYESIEESSLRTITSGVPLVVLEILISTWTNQKLYFLSYLFSLSCGGSFLLDSALNHLNLSLRWKKPQILNAFSVCAFPSSLRSAQSNICNVLTLALL
jgi:hypothetical protein